MSEFGVSVQEKKRLIIKNPDGSYTHCKFLLYYLTRL